MDGGVFSSQWSVFSMDFEPEGGLGCVDGLGIGVEWVSGMLFIQGLAKVRRVGLSTWGCCYPHKWGSYPHGYVKRVDFGYCLLSEKVLVGGWNGRARGRRVLTGGGGLDRLRRILFAGGGSWSM